MKKDELLKKIQSSKEIIANDGDCSMLLCHDCPLFTNKENCFADEYPYWVKMTEEKKKVEKIEMAKEFLNKYQIWIVCAANKLKSGLIVCGARHHDKIMNGQIEAAGDTHIGEKQGFIDQRGKWWSRSDAMDIVKCNGQKRRDVPGAELELYSENLY
jgi:hypothetical protein